MDVVIYGAGGHGSVVFNIVQESGVHRPVMWLDSDPALEGASKHGLPVTCDLAGPFSRGINHAVVAVGDNVARVDIAARLEVHGYHLTNAIHPRAWVSSGIASLGKNVVVCAGAHVCTGCRIGDSVILNTACIVDHESTIAEGTHICPGARLAGRVHVGRKCFLGLGCSVIQNVTIGEDAVVGAGAVVLDNVLPQTTVVGVPAQPIHRGQSVLGESPPSVHGEAC